MGGGRSLVELHGPPQAFLGLWRASCKAWVEWKGLGGMEDESGSRSGTENRPSA
jgi:hypothetical protein